LREEEGAAGAEAMVVDFEAQWRLGVVDEGGIPIASASLLAALLTWSFCKPSKESESNGGLTYW